MRWNYKKKVEVVAEVGKGLSLADACKKYDLSEEELRNWIFKYHHFGPRSLRMADTKSCRVRSAAST